MAYLDANHMRQIDEAAATRVLIDEWLHKNRPELFAGLPNVIAQAFKPLVAQPHRKSSASGTPSVARPLASIS
jgi:hypothetical protein